MSVYVTVCMSIFDLYVFVFSTIRTSHCTLQVDGFKYMCMLGDSTLPAPYNTTDGSVMCTILEGNVRDSTPLNI